MVRRSFESSEESVAAARRFVADRIPDVAVEVRDSIAVMVSELSTNALVHAAGGFEVSVDRSDGDVVVSVSDQEDGTPILRTPDFNEPHGRGLRIVDALSDEWGVSSNANAGKSVWFRMAIATSEADGSAAGSDGVRADKGQLQDGSRQSGDANRLSFPKDSHPRTSASHRRSRRPSPRRRPKRSDAAN